MRTMLRISDMRVRMTAQKVEMIAAEIAWELAKEPDVADAAIEILYEETRALRNKEGLDRDVFEKIQHRLKTFNLVSFLNEHELMVDYQ